MDLCEDFLSTVLLVISIKAACIAINPIGETALIDPI